MVEKYKLDLNMCKTTTNTSLLASITSIDMFRLLKCLGYEPTIECVKQYGQMLLNDELVIYLIRQGYCFDDLLPKNRPKVWQKCRQARQKYEQEVMCCFHSLLPECLTKSLLLFV